MKIVELRQISADRYLIIFDDGTEIKAVTEVVANGALHTGKELSDKDYLLMLEAQSLARAKNRALKIIGARPVSKRDLIRRLREKGEPEEIAQSVAQWLEELGYIDDAEYAETVVRHFAEKGYGRARVRNELYNRGVPRELWDAALSGLPEMDEKLDRLIFSRLGGEVPDRAQLRRATDALFRRGFSWDEISAAVARYKERIKN